MTFGSRRLISSGQVECSSTHKTSERPIPRQALRVTRPRPRRDVASDLCFGTEDARVTNRSSVIFPTSVKGSSLNGSEMVDVESACVLEGCAVTVTLLPPRHDSVAQRNAGIDRILTWLQRWTAEVAKLEAGRHDQHSKTQVHQSRRHQVGMGRFVYDRYV